MNLGYKDNKKHWGQAIACSETRKGITVQKSECSVDGRDERMIYDNPDKRSAISNRLPYKNF